MDTGDIMLGGGETLRWTSIPSRGCSITPRLVLLVKETRNFAIASSYQTSKVPSRSFGGRQFYVRQENPLFTDSYPSAGHPPKKLPSIDFFGHTKNFASHMRTRLQKRKIGDYKLFKLFAKAKLDFSSLMRTRPQ